MIHTAWNNLIAPAVLATQSSGAGSSGNEEAAAAGIMALGAAVCCGGILVSLAIQAVICWFTYSAQKKVPQQFQQMAPGMIWLNMIPLFVLVWNFFVYSKVPQSLQAALSSQGKSAGDCGQKWGLWYSISVVACTVSSFLPLLNLILSPLSLLAAIIFCIMTLVAITGAAKQLS